MTILAEALIYLLAAVVAVTISRRLGLGSIQGYLAAGIFIGPFGFSLVSDADDALHFAELGVVFLLFIVGLELKPSRLWLLRRMVFGLGAAQFLFSALAIALLAWMLGYGGRAAAVTGLILALSSTAFVLQMLSEKKQLGTTHGRAAFSILLFQDLAAIPLIAMMPFLAVSGGAENGIDAKQVAIMILTICGLIVGGRFVIRPALRVAAGAGIPEIFTAMALLVVIGAAMLMYVVGMSMILGAFIAGMMLADSEYRHQLEADIGPFKGLLLGLFFIAVGMSVNLGLLLQIPGRIAIIVLLLIAVKAAVLFPLARIFHIGDRAAALKLSVSLAQGGEFAFVLLGIAAGGRILPSDHVEELILAVAISMLMTPFIFSFAQKAGDNLAQSDTPAFDIPGDQHNDILIAGFGRVGQIIGRLLSMAGKSFTAVEKDSSQVDFVRRYGAVVHYGDASRPELLRAAGAANAKLFILAIPDLEESIRVADVVRRNFPNLKIIARARNRRHAHKLMNVGVEHIYRETLLSSLAMSEDVLTTLGQSAEDVERIIATFSERDSRLLQEQFAIHDSEDELIQSARDAAAELERLMQQEELNQDETG